MTNKPSRTRAEKPVSSGTTGGQTPVLYIHPPKQGVGYKVEENIGRAYGLLPVGVPALMNLLYENGVAVRGLNYAMERALRPSFNLENWLTSHRGVRLILVDLHWYEHCFGALDVVKFCKQVLPWAWTVIGGMTASGFSEQILENFPEVDYIVRGDAEQPLLALVQRLLHSGKRAGTEMDLEDIPNLAFRRGGKIVHSLDNYVASSQDLDRLEFANLDFLVNYQDYLSHEYLVTDLDKALRARSDSKPLLGRWLCTARGCIYHCSYCGGSKESHQLLAHRSELIKRSPSRVVEDLAYLQAMGVHQAALSYDIAQLGEAYWKDLFSQMCARGVRIGLYNEFFQAPMDEFIEDLANSADMSHTCVALSPLSGNECVRRLNGKIFSNDQLFDTLEKLNEFNFNIFVYFSLNLPGETGETFQETLDLALQIYDFYPTSLLKILDTVHTLDPFSPMSLYPDKFGIDTSLHTFMDWYTYCKNTLKRDPSACTELHRGFSLKEKRTRTLEQMATAWEAARSGKENSWYPIPPSW